MNGINKTYLKNLSSVFFASESLYLSSFSFQLFSAVHMKTSALDRTQSTHVGNTGGESHPWPQRGLSEDDTEE